jgi:hypothetical protein
MIVFMHWYVNADALVNYWSGDVLVEWRERIFVSRQTRSTQVRLRFARVYFYPDLWRTQWHICIMYSLKMVETAHSRPFPAAPSLGSHSTVCRIHFRLKHNKAQLSIVLFFLFCSELLGLKEGDVCKAMISRKFSTATESMQTGLNMGKVKFSTLFKRCYWVLHKFEENKK